MLHVINISEACSPEVRGEWRKDGASHGWLVDIRSLGYQEFYELGQLLGHGWRSRIFLVAIITLSLEV